MNTRQRLSKRFHSVLWQRRKIGEHDARHVFHHYPCPSSKHAFAQHLRNGDGAEPSQNSIQSRKIKDVSGVDAKEGLAALPKWPRNLPFSDCAHDNGFLRRGDTPDIARVPGVAGVKIHLFDNGRGEKRLQIHNIESP